jgi:hypothetical protein
MGGEESGLVLILATQKDRGKWIMTRRREKKETGGREKEKHEKGEEE